MNHHFDRRQFLKLAGLGGAVFASALNGWAKPATSVPHDQDFYFVQLSDTHWGFNDPAINPDASGRARNQIAGCAARIQSPRLRDPR